MAGHVTIRRLEKPQTAKILLGGCTLWKWDEVKAVTRGMLLLTTLNVVSAPDNDGFLSSVVRDCITFLSCVPLYVYSVSVCIQEYGVVAKSVCL